MRRHNIATTDDFRVHVYREWNDPTHGPCHGKDIHLRLADARQDVADARGNPNTTLVEARIYRPGDTVEPSHVVVW